MKVYRKDTTIDTIQPATTNARLEGQVLVPLARAFISTAIASAFLFLVLHSVPPAVPLALFFIVWAIESHWFRRLIWPIETKIKKDLDGDGKIGDPWANEHLTIEVEGDPDFPLDTASWGWDRNRCILFSRAVAQVDDFTEERWGRRKDLFPGRINQFRRIRGYMEQAGFLERTSRARNATWTKTDKGVAMFRKVATLPIHEH